MNKEKIRVLDILKIFEEKGYDKEELEKLVEIDKKKKKKKYHEITKITDLKDMINKSGTKFINEPAFRFKTEKLGHHAVLQAWS